MSSWKTGCITSIQFSDRVPATYRAHSVDEEDGNDEHDNVDNHTAPASIAVCKGRRQLSEDQNGLPGANCKTILYHYMA